MIYSDILQVIFESKNTAKPFNKIHKTDGSTFIACIQDLFIMALLTLQEQDIAVSFLGYSNDQIFAFQCYRPTKILLNGLASDSLL